MCIRRCISAAAALVLLVTPAGAADTAGQVLEGYGLRSDGQTWVLPEHGRLRHLMHRFDAQLRAFHKTQQAWQEQIEQIDALEKQLQQLETGYEESRRLLQKQSGNLIVQQQIQEQRGNLSQRIGELRLALKKRQNEETSDLYKAARRHAAARAELLSTTSAIDETYRRLAERYKSLAASASVRQALRELRTATGLEHALASATSLGPDVEAAVRRAGRALDSGELPLLLSGGEVKVDVLAGGKPTSFAVDEDKPQTLVPLSHAERIGISLGDAALWQKVVYGDRTLRLCAARLATLKIGGVTLRDAEVYVSATDGADLGLRLGSDLLDQFKLTIDRGRARIEIRPSLPRRDARK